MRPVVDIEIQAVNRSSDIAVFQRSFRAVAVGQNRQAIRADRRFVSQSRSFRDNPVVAGVVL